jgi:hypothetical protein
MNYSEVFMRIRQWLRFYFLKNVTLPHLAVLHENLKAGWWSLLFTYFDKVYFQEKIFVSFFKNFNRRRASQQNCFRILWTWSDWHTCLSWYCNPQLLQPRFSTIFPHEPLALFLQRCYHKKLFNNLCQIKICRQPLTHSLSRNHHVDIFGGNPFVDGILGHSLLLSRAFLGGNPLVDEIF